MNTRKPVFDVDTSVDHSNPKHDRAFKQGVIVRKKVEEENENLEDEIAYDKFKEECPYDRGRMRWNFMKGWNEERKTDNE
jgi:hypothetical protein